MKTGMSIGDLRSTVAIAWDVYAHDVTITFGPREVVVTTPTKQLFAQKLGDLYDADEDGMGAILAACAEQMTQRAEMVRGMVQWHAQQRADAVRSAEAIEARLAEVRALVQAADEAG